MTTELIQLTNQPKPAEITLLQRVTAPTGRIDFLEGEDRIEVTSAEK